MNIKKKFVISNIIMLIAPIVLIGAVTIIFLVLFILSYPTYNLDINRIELLNPQVLIQTLASIVENDTGAVRYIFLWGLLCALIVVGVITVNTIILSKSILGPIRELTQAAKNIKNGNLDFEVMRASAEEIDVLCRVFEEMRIKLKQSEKNDRCLIEERKMLLANISHDLKTPITSIKGYIEGIKDGVADTPEKMDKYLSTIYQKANVIDDMVNNISIFSKLELNKIQFDFELGNINEFINQIADEYKLDLQKNNMNLSLDISDIPAIVKIDYQRMHRVFSNLIENAIKYKKDGQGHLSITTEISNGGVFVILSDQGIGINRMEIDKVFEGFYRIDPSRNLNIKGNGLGLGIAKQIVENHGGKIWLKSEEGHGTTAFVYLPIRKDKDIDYEQNINY